MNGYNKRLGELGEKRAAFYLKLKGYRILDRNYRLRNGEIDIIASDPKGVIVFAEVKTRTSDAKGTPAEAVDYYKRKHLAVAADYYILKKKLHGKKARFDVIEVRIKQKGIFKLFKINHIKNAFEG